MSTENNISNINNANTGNVPSSASAPIEQVPSSPNVIMATPIDNGNSNSPQFYQQHQQILQQQQFIIQQQQQLLQQHLQQSQQQQTQAPTQKLIQFPTKTVEPDPFLGAVAAGSAGGFMAGSFLGMPFTGSFAGGIGCGYLAATRPVGDKWGDRVRAIGLRTSIFMITATEWAHQHKVVDKIQDTTSKAMEKAKLINEEHQVIDKAKDVTVKVVTSAKEFNDQYQPIEKVTRYGSQAMDKAKEIDNEYKIRDKTIDALHGVIQLLEKSKQSNETKPSIQNQNPPTGGVSQV